MNPRVATAPSLLAPPCPPPDPLMTIAIDIAPPFQSLVSAERLVATAQAALDHLRAQGDLTLVVVEDAEIADLNRRFLGGEGPTDVLSFPAQGEDDFVTPPDLAPYLGDIIIAYPYAARQAAAQGHAVAAELDLLVVHGVLHLLGFDHADEAEKKHMWAQQDAILMRKT